MAVQHRDRWPAPRSPSVRSGIARQARATAGRASRRAQPRIASMTRSFHMQPPSRNPVATKKVARQSEAPQDRRGDLLVVGVAVVEGDRQRARRERAGVQALDSPAASGSTLNQSRTQRIRASNSAASAPRGTAGPVRQHAMEDQDAQPALAPAGATRTERQAQQHGVPRRVRRACGTSPSRQFSGYRTDIERSSRLQPQLERSSASGSCRRFGSRRGTRSTASVQAAAADVAAPGPRRVFSLNAVGKVSRSSPPQTACLNR